MIIHSQNNLCSKNYYRIVSLVPSQTELLYDLGLHEEVIGITKFCVHPSVWHKTKLIVGGTKTVKINLVHELKPDLIIANKEENVKEQIEELSKFFDVFVTDVNNLDDALQMIHDVGILTGKTSSALKLAEAITIKFKKLQEIVVAKDKIKTAYLIWKNPYMAVGAGTFINDMMQYCGLENVYANMQRYPQISLADLQNDKTNCEMILLSSEPYPFNEKHIKEIQSQIPAIKIILADGEMFSWYGSRLLKAVEYFENFYEKISLLR